MKRVYGLFESIYHRDNLGAAVWKAARGKYNKPEVKNFIANADNELTLIAQQIQNGQLQFQDYQQFEVRDTKTRTIQAPSFRDRVIHNAIIRVTGPVFERSAICNSYACRAGKGQHAALKQLSQWVKRSQWYGKIDVLKYYDSIPHQQLLMLLADRFGEQRLIALFESLLNSYQCTPNKGLPIGALTSQYLGNFYLDEFDRRLLATTNVKYYMRYMDDMIMLGTREQMTAARSEAQQILSTLQLSAKHDGEWNRASQGIPYLGFTVYPDRLRLNPGARKRLRKKWTDVRAQFKAGVMTEAEVQARGSAIFAHAEFSDDIAWRRTVLSFFDCEEKHSGDV